MPDVDLRRKSRITVWNTPVQVLPNHGGVDASTDASISTWSYAKILLLYMPKVSQSLEQ